MHECLSMNCGYSSSPSFLKLRHVYLDMRGVPIRARDGEGQAYSNVEAGLFEREGRPTRT